MQGQRSSRGILQGLYPSDLLGAFYMHGADRHFDDLNIASARYVDDIYIFVGSVDESDAVLRQLIPFLRSYDLHLNEVKSGVIPKVALFAEEPDLEELFSDAIAEVSEQVDDDDPDTDYGFQKDWDEEDEETAEDDEPDSIELQATQNLFDSIDNYPGHEEEIERFCIPLFTKAESDYAIGHVLEALSRRPAMTQIYAAYLAKFVKDAADIREDLVDVLDDPSYFDWQKMWVIATLMQAGRASNASIKTAMSILNTPSNHDALRASAAMYVGRYGDHDRRKSLVGIYPRVSEYIQLAIYFTSKLWPAVERRNARESWGGLTFGHKLMSRALSPPS